MGNTNSLNSALDSESVLNGGNTDRKYSDFYESLEVIGNGSFAVVKKCVRKSDNKLFAVKSIHKKKLNKNELLSIKKEVLILQKLSTINNVINIIDVFEDDKKIKIILELCASNDLFDLIANAPKNGLSEEKSAQICAIIAVSMKYIHRLGIVHRDLKPENIIFTKDGVLKITDFGLAHYRPQNNHSHSHCNNKSIKEEKEKDSDLHYSYHSNSDSESNEDDDYHSGHLHHHHHHRHSDSDSDSHSGSHSGSHSHCDSFDIITEDVMVEQEIIDDKYCMETCCGTPQYVAPEIINRDLYGKECDYWSLGVILYCMLSGTQPFNSHSILSLYKLILNGAYDFPSKYWKNISFDAIDLCKKLMCVDPKQRINADALMRHPWIVKHVPNIHVLDKAIAKQLQ